MRWGLVSLFMLAGCGDNVSGVLTPERMLAFARPGDHVTVLGEVHTTTFDSMQTMTRVRELYLHRGDFAAVLEDGAEEVRGEAFAYDDAGARYPRTPAHYVLIRSQTPPDVAHDLAQGWGLGVYVPEIDPANPLPEIGSHIQVTGTYETIDWNQQGLLLPIIDNATIEVVDGPPPLAGPGAACSLDQDCNARLICDRASRTCMSPPREIYWADPWRDVNGACDSDADCPLGETCDPTYTVPATGLYSAHYFAQTDIGRHLCILTAANPCTRVYTTRDLAGARFVTGKEICVRASLISPVPAADGDTHDQMHVDEPKPYPIDDAGYDVWGATTENGPVYKNPALPGGMVVDPTPGQEVIAVGTYRYDPDHGWYEIHPVKRYLTP